MFRGSLYDFRSQALVSRTRTVQVLGHNIVPPQGPQSLPCHAHNIFYKIGRVAPPDRHLPPDARTRSFISLQPDYFPIYLG